MCPPTKYNPLRVLAINDTGEMLKTYGKQKTEWNNIKFIII